MLRYATAPIASSSTKDIANPNAIFFPKVHISTLLLPGALQRRGFDGRDHFIDGHDGPYLSSQTSTSCACTSPRRVRRPRRIRASRPGCAELAIEDIERQARRVPAPADRHPSRRAARGIAEQQPQVVDRNDVASHACQPQPMGNHARESRQGSQGQKARDVAQSQDVGIVAKTDREEVVEQGRVGMNGLGERSIERVAQLQGLVLQGIAGTAHAETSVPCTAVRALFRWSCELMPRLHRTAVRLGTATAAPRAESLRRTAASATRPRAGAR